MSSLLSSFISSSSSSNQSSSAQAFILRPDPNNSTITTVHLPNAPPNAYPIYSIASNSSTNPSILFFRGSNDPRNIIGEGDSKNFTLSNRSITMKKSSLSGSFSFEYAPLGALKWKDSDLSGSPELRNERGTKVAKLKSLWMTGSKGKEFRFLVPCDGAFVEVVLLTVVVMKALGKKEMDTALEVLEAVAGVSG